MEQKLTVLQAFESMKKYLDKYYQRTTSDDIAQMLGELEFCGDLQTMDPAAWYDWIESVDEILKNEVHKKE